MTYAQEGYRFRKDDQGEMSASWLDPQDVPQVMSMRPLPGVNEPGSQGIWTPRRAGINVPASADRSIFIAAHIRPFGLRTETIISRFDTPPNRCLHFMVRSDGAVLFGWSPDGTNVVDISSTVQWFSPVHSYPIHQNQSFWIGVMHIPFFDVLRQTRFYVAPARELLLDHELGARVDWGATGNIFDSTTANWYLGLRIDGGFHNNSDIYSVEAYASPNMAESETDPFGWNPLLNPNFSDFTQGWRPGMTGVVQPAGGWDGVGNMWTVSWDREIAGGIRKTVPIRVRTLMNATGDPATAQAGLMYKRVDEPDSEWRLV